MFTFYQQIQNASKNNYFYLKKQENKIKLLYNQEF